VPAPLVLASTSPYRRALLERLAVPFEQVDPGVDERAVVGTQEWSPRETALALAQAKARAVAWAHPDRLILGSDQVCACDGRILGKPGDRAGAIAQLAGLQGRTHQLFTAVCWIAEGVETTWVDLTTLTMLPLDPAAIERYVDRDEPWDCAGSYKLERGGIGLFERVESADHTAVIGLPLLQVARELRSRGHAVP